MDLFEQVLHAIEGGEAESRTAFTATGEKAVCIRTFGPDRWFEKAVLGRLDAINFLAVILFAVRDTFNLDAERRIVEDWATAIRAAAEIGEIVPRDQITLLPLHTLPDGWEWLVSIDDADSFVKARGMGWSCSSIVEHLATQSTSPQIALLEQNPHLFATKHANKQPPASSGTPESDESTVPALEEKQPIIGVDRNKILAHFTPPNGTTAANWSKTLSDPPKWLIGARVFKGRASVSSLWNPAMFAMAYAEKGIMTKLKLTEIIRREFAPWLPEWEKYTSSFD